MPRPKKTFLYILTGFLILLISAVSLLFYLKNNPDLMSSLEPSSTIEISTGTSESEHDSLRRLQLDNNYWTHRIQLAQDKSIDLLLDLPARQILLEIQGVTVYSASIVYYNPNDALLALTGSERLSTWLAEPFLLVNEQASIAKEPIQVREIQVGADPSDDHMTRIREPEKDEEVIINLFFDRKLSITLRQIEFIPENRSDMIHMPDSTEYYLEIYLDKEAAKTIFRAVSIDQTGLALRPE